MTTRIQLGKDVNGQTTFDMPMTDTTQSFPLTANTPVTVGVPANAQTCFFSFSKAADVWVSYVGVGSIPTATRLRLLENGYTRLLENGFDRLLEGVGGYSTSSAQILNPERLFVGKGSQLTFVTSATGAYVNLCYYTKTFAALGRIS